MMIFIGLNVLAVALFLIGQGQLIPVLFGFLIILTGIPVSWNLYQLSQDIKLEEWGVTKLSQLTQLPKDQVIAQYEAIYHSNSQAPVKMRLEAVAKFYDVELFKS
ncbi:hypothetical protein THF1C08_320082 [Vibrio jasicida]|uniref:Uncharacterized protein n=1 Tax=Vibrio jasicida TaxID=766224 RepID=A0AAU9QPF5_9VIBR|nr:hypothetical protein THF1C08_320082 [Vibrio jasicida]CAH1597504.1 hypothetical protein THF1A12_320081 [Vibrio jasicida]